MPFELRISRSEPMGQADLEATVGSRPVIALPGNPQAAVVGLLTLGSPLVDACLGVPERPVQQVVAGTDIPGHDESDRLLPGVIDRSRFVASAHVGSAMLRGLAGSSGYARVPPEGVRAGEPIDWLPLP